MPKFEYTREHIKSSKLALLIGSLTAAVADVFVVVLLMIAGLWSYVALPIVLAVADIAFFVIALFTNFRFRYSLTYTLGYLAIFIGCVLGHLFIIYGGKETAMTAIALIIWVAVHVLNFLVTVLGAKGAVTKKKGHHFVTALIVLLFIGATGIYVAFGSSMGYFGQGSTTARPILYVYDEQTGTYTATGVLSGNGTTATIPAEFDGKPVGAIDASLFNANRLNTLRIETESNVEIKNLDKLDAVNVAEIYAPRETLTTLQREFYTAYRDMDVKNELLLTLAQCSAPSDLQKDEIYITFSYTDRAMACIGESYLPSWIGSKGDKFQLSELAKEIGYIQDTDVTDEALLHELYTNGTSGGGYILLPIMLDATTPLNGATIQKSHKNLTVDFEKIYRVKVEEDNDTLHSFSDNFEMDIVVDGTTVAYRYVTPSTMGELLPSVTERPGFTLAWEYKYANNVTSNVADTTESALFSALNERNLRDFSVIPTWTMNVPTINTLASNKNSNAFTYGDNVDFTVNATAPAAGTVLSYEWFFLDESKQNDSQNTFNVSPIRMEEAGTYKVVVTASSDTVTSLTSVSEQTIDLTVAKKGISMNWSVIGESGAEYTHVYDKADHAIAVTFNESDFVFGDDFTSLSWSYTCNNATYTSGVNARAAGTYGVTVALLGDNADKYTLNNPSKEYTIERKSVNVVWTNTTLTYNALEQAPTATAKPEDVCEGDTVTITVGGGKIDTNLKANEQTYKATASLVDTQDQNANYRLVSDTTAQAFTIEPTELTVKWTGDNASETDFEYTYNGQGHRPVAVFTGILYNQNLELTYNADQTNANVNGESYTATVTVGNKNYFVANKEIVLSQTFTIAPKKLTVSWRGENNSTGDFSWIYDAKEHRPVALFTGLVGSDSQNESYTDTKTEAGTYTATVTVGNTNYYIDDIDKIHEFTIEKRQLSIYSVVKSFVYDATAKYPTYLVDNLVAGTDAGFVFMDGTNAFDKKTNVGSYPCKLIVTNPNYAFADTEMTLEITKKPLTITNWQTQMTYNAEELFPTYTLNGVCEGDTVGVSGCSVNITASGAQVNVGQNYVATLTFESENYSIASSYLTSTFKIVPKSITIDWGKVDFIYNGEAQKPTPTVIAGELYGFDTVTIVVAGAQTNTNAYAGNQRYTATATSENPNYAISNNQTTFTIAPYTIEYGSIVWYGEDESTSDFSWVYDGSVKAPTAKAVGVLGENVELRISAGQKNANLYTETTQYDVTATSQNKNYVIAEGADINVKHFTITPKELTVTWSGEDDETPFAWIYSATTHNPVATFEGKVGSDNLVLTYSAAQKNVGAYDATVSVGNKNYYVSNETTLSQHFEIVAKALTFEWGTSEFVFDNTNKFPSYTITGYAGTESENTLKATKIGTQKNAGSYDVSFMIDNANYYIVDDVNLYGTMTIAKRVIKPNFSTNTLTLTYNGQEQRPSYTWSNVINGYAFENNVTVTTDNTPKDVNTYELTISIADENYEFEGGATEVRQSFEIVKRTLTVGNIVSTFTFDGGEHYPTYTVNNLVQGDDAGFIFNDVKQTNAGTYSYTLSITNPNYAFTERTITMKINQKSLTPSWGNASFTYNGEAQAPTAVATDVTGHTFDLIITGAQTNVKSSGSYTATASLPEEYAANYKLSSTTKTFTIAKLAVEVQWENLTFVYNAIAHAPTASATGVNDFNVPISVSGAKTNAGTYTATATTTNGNYTLTGNTVQFTIEKKDVSVVWGNTSFTYNGNAQVPTATATGVSGEAININVSGAQTNAGTYTASATTGNSNYKLTNETVGFTISPKEVEVFWANTSLTYNGSAQAPTASATGAKGEAIDLTVLGAQTNARTTPYMATATTENQNYTLTFHQQEFTIGKRTVSVTWTNTELTYNGNSQAPTATVMGVNGVRLSIDVTGAQTNAGTYTASATLTSSTDMNNYTLENVTVQYTIAKMRVTVQWSNTTLTYNGAPQKPTAKATGAKNQSVPIEVSGAQSSVGTHTATASTANPNYELVNATVQYTITQR